MIWVSLLGQGHFFRALLKFLHGAVFEPEAVIAGLQDMGIMGQTPDDLVDPTLRFFLCQNVNQSGCCKELGTFLVMFNGPYAECGSKIEIACSRPADEDDIVDRLDEVAAVRLAN